jgi:hypothetical protein
MKRFTFLILLISILMPQIIFGAQPQPQSGVPVPSGTPEQQAVVQPMVPAPPQIPMAPGAQPQQQGQVQAVPMPQQTAVIAPAPVSTAQSQQAVQAQAVQKSALAPGAQPQKSAPVQAVPAQQQMAKPGVVAPMPGTQAKPVQIAQPPAPVKAPVLLTPEQKIASDKLLLEAFKKIAQAKNVTYIAPQGVKIKVTVQAKQPISQEFNNSFDAYLFFIKQTLLEEALLENDKKERVFKKRSELNDFIGGPGKKGSFDTFVEEHVKMKANENVNQFLEDMYKQLADDNSPLVTDLLNLIMPQIGPSLIFDYEDFIKNAKSNLLTIITNIALSQRPEIQPQQMQPQQKDQSDAQVISMLAEWIRKIQADGGFKKFVEGNKTVQVTLTKPYIKLLYYDVNRLRLHPQFLKFDTLLGNKIVVSDKELTKIPFLELLKKKNVKVFEFPNFYAAMQAQLFFNPASLEKVIGKNSDELKAALLDHIRILNEQAVKK